MNTKTEMQHYLPCIEAAKIKAQELGLLITFPTDKELQIDIDSEVDLLYFKNITFPILEQFYQCYIGYKTSKSGEGHYHLTITLPFAIDRWQRLALQASLGSDRKRELLGCIMALNGEETPTLFMNKDG